jgi:hypothetical protein
VVVRFTREDEADAPPERVAVRFQKDAGLVQHGDVLQNAAGEALVWLGSGWSFDAAGERLVGRLARGESLMLGVFSSPLVKPPALGALTAAAYEKLHDETAAAWERQLAGCMTLETPEDVVNRAWRTLVVAQLMMAAGDEMRYSAGNVYARLYEAEAGDALRSLLTFGRLDDARRMTDPLLRYTQQGLDFHNDAFKLQLLCHVYWVTRDAQFVRDRGPLWRPIVRHILDNRQAASGLLPKEDYAGDIQTKVDSLNSNANCWRGLRDMAAVLRDVGEAEEAGRIAAGAGELRAATLAALDKSEFRDTKPPFVPVALFGAERPYDPITATVMGTYWNLLIPYVLGSDLLDDRRTRDTLDYLHAHGGIAMGMMRIHQHSGLFANEDAVDDLYALRYVQTLLRLDQVDRALVSFYGKLAQGLTRDTFIGGEGSGLIPLDPRGRPMYLPPNAAGNALLLTTLRELLVQDQDLDHDGAPEALRLLFATPRDWLADGKTIRLEHAPSAFGRVSVIARSNLTNGDVTVEVRPPPAEHAPSSVRLRARLPEGWRVTAASIDGGTPLRLDGGDTVDVSRRHLPFVVRFGVAR